MEQKPIEKYTDLELAEAIAMIGQEKERVLLNWAIVTAELNKRKPKEAKPE